MTRMWVVALTLAAVAGLAGCGSNQTEPPPVGYNEVVGPVYGLPELCEEVPFYINSALNRDDIPRRGEVPRLLHELNNLPGNRPWSDGARALAKRLHADVQRVANDYSFTGTTAVPPRVRAKRDLDEARIALHRACR